MPYGHRCGRIDKRKDERRRATVFADYADGVTAGSGIGWRSDG